MKGCLSLLVLIVLSSAVYAKGEKCCKQIKALLEDMKVQLDDLQETVEEIKNKTTTTSEGCQNYQILSNGDRKDTSGLGDLLCDDSLGPGWFRFQGAAGTKMATSCVPTNHCGTHAPGFLNGAHPTLAEGIVTRQVCFNYSSNCCQWAIDIQVQSCGDFFVYYIDGTPKEHPCHLRYCGAD